MPAVDSQETRSAWDVAELELTLVGNLGAAVAPVAEGAGAPVPPGEGQAAGLASANPPLADLELRVTRTDAGELAFVLNSALPELRLNAQPVGRISLLAPDLRTFFRDRLQKAVEQTARRYAAEGSRRLAQELESLGEGLFERLFPLELQQVYWEQIHPLATQGTIKTLLISSDETWIPWEMIKPYRRNDAGGSEQRAPFLAEQFALSRGAQGPLPSSLTVKRAALVMPDLNLTYVQEERAFLERLALERQVHLQEQMQRYDEVIASLRAGDFQLLHFATFGSVNPANSDLPGLSLVDQKLTPADLVGGNLRGLRRTRPLVFVNAGSGGETYQTMAALQTWARKFLVEARASAFVGAQWEVSDELAAAFSEQFYTLLAQGHPLAEAARGARLHIREVDPSNPSWLAYVVYGDPNLIVEFAADSPAQQPVEVGETAGPAAGQVSGGEEVEAAEGAAAVEAVDWYVEWESVPAGELLINQGYTLALRFSRTSGVPVRVPTSSQALTVFIDAAPGLQLETGPRLHVPAQAGRLLQEHFELRFRPVMAGAASLGGHVYAGREVDAAPVVLPRLALRVAPPLVLPDIPEMFDGRLAPAPLPDVLLYVALEAIPVTAHNPDGVQLRPYLGGALAVAAGLDIVRLAPLALAPAAVTDLAAAVAAAAQETQDGLAGGDPPALRRLGMALYDLLMPPSEAQPSDAQAANPVLDLRTAYWRLAWLARRSGRAPTWLVISDPHAVLPWELVRPYAESGREEDFLAAQFVLAHWIGRSRLRLDRLAPVRKLELVHYGQAPGDLPAWQASLGGADSVEIATEGDLLLTQSNSEVVGLHLLRYADDGGPGRIVSAHSGPGHAGAAGEPRPGGEVVAAAAERRRLDFAARHPVVGLSWVDARLGQRGWLPGPVGAAPVDEWALPLLAAEATAVVGPRWPTAVASDRRFYAVFYAAMRAGRRLGEAVREARLAVRAGAPQNGDWLAYAYYGHPACEPYQVVRAEAFALFEITGHPDDRPLAPGQEYTFRAAYRALAPENYQGRVYLEQPLPALADPKALVDANFLDEPLAAPLQRTGDLAYEALFTLRMPVRGDVARVTVYFQDGGERLQVLDLYLDLDQAAAPAGADALAGVPAGGRDA